MGWNGLCFYSTGKNFYKRNECSSQCHRPPNDDDNNPSPTSPNLSHPLVPSHISCPRPFTPLTALLALNLQSLATNSPVPAAPSVASVVSMPPKLSYAST